MNRKSITIKFIAVILMGMLLGGYALGNTMLPTLQAQTYDTRFGLSMADSSITGNSSYTLVSTDVWGVRYYFNDTDVVGAPGYVRRPDTRNELTTIFGMDPGNPTTEQQLLSASLDYVQIPFDLCFDTNNGKYWWRCTQVEAGHFANSPFHQTAAPHMIHMHDNGNYIWDCGTNSSDDTSCNPTDSTGRLYMEDEARFRTFIQNNPGKSYVIFGLEPHIRIIDPQSAGKVMAYLTDYILDWDSTAKIYLGDVDPNLFPGNLADAGRVQDRWNRDRNCAADDAAPTSIRCNDSNNNGSYNDEGDGYLDFRDWWYLALVAYKNQLSALGRSVQSSVDGFFVDAAPNTYYSVNDGIFAQSYIRRGDSWWYQKLFNMVVHWGHFVYGAVVDFLASGAEAWGFPQATPTNSDQIFAAMGRFYWYNANQTQGGQYLCPVIKDTAWYDLDNDGLYTDDGGDSHTYTMSLSSQNLTYGEAVCDVEGEGLDADNGSAGRKWAAANVPFEIVYSGGLYRIEDWNLPPDNTPDGLIAGALAVQYMMRWLIDYGMNQYYYPGIAHLYWKTYLWPGSRDILNLPYVTNCSLQWPIFSTNGGGNLTPVGLAWKNFVAGNTTWWGTGTWTSDQTCEQESCIPNSADWGTRPSIREGW